MSQAVAAPGMTGDEMVALCRQHSLYEWSVQGRQSVWELGEGKRVEHPSGSVLTTPYSG